MDRERTVEPSETFFRLKVESPLPMWLSEKLAANRPGRHWQPQPVCGAQQLVSQALASGIKGEYIMAPPHGEFGLQY